MQPAFLTLGGGRSVEVADHQHLGSLLSDLDEVEDGEAAILERGPADFIKAHRRGALWSVTTRRAGMWSAQSFTAAITSDYSERAAQEGRQHRWFAWLRWWLRSPRPERALSTGQVRTLFGEYLAGQRFTIPFAGAGT